MFKKLPQNYNEDDLKQYKKILMQTSAHKRSFKVDNQISGDKSNKYKKIIKPLFSETVGKGLIKDVKNFNNKTIKYVYWNTASELIQRLMILVASRDAGNTGHNNEILAIEEELREADIIE